MQIHGRVCSSYPIRHHIAPIRIDQNRAVAWRKSPLVAVVARTDPARQADASSGLRRRDVDPVGIDEIPGILRLAPQRDGVAARDARIASRWLHQIGRASWRERVCQYV